MKNTVLKKCCGLCPYSRKNTLFLHPERASEFAINASNPYTDFICHKTGVINEDHPDEYHQSEIVRGNKSLTCAGFYAMQTLTNGTSEKCEITIDFDDHFMDYWEMVEHHEENYNG